MGEELSGIGDDVWSLVGDWEVRRDIDDEGIVDGNVVVLVVVKEGGRELGEKEGILEGVFDGS